MTTYSCSACAVLVKVTLIVVCPVKAIVCFSIPIKEKTIDLEPAGTDNVKLPFMSVVVPKLVPSITTDTPGSEPPSSALLTVPVTVVCAKTL